MEDFDDLSDDEKRKISDIYQHFKEQIQNRREYEEWASNAFLNSNSTIVPQKFLPYKNMPLLVVLTKANQIFPYVLN